MECKLSRDEEKQILGWLAKPSWRLELLFSADRDGCDDDTFHRLCDNKGPTVMVVWNTNGWLFGGYTSKDWDNETENYKADDQAFMFRLKTKDEFQPIQFNRGEAPTGVFCSITTGPLFGCAKGGIEYQPFNQKQNKVNGRYTTVNLGTYNAYIKPQITGPNASNSRSLYELCNNEKYYYDCHIYKFQELPDPILELPWRKVIEKWSDQTVLALKEEITKYSPPRELNTDKVNILLLGPVGAGKSSFFNTVNSLYKGYVSSRAVTGSSPQCITTKYRKYEVCNLGSKDNLKIKICDTLGLDEQFGLDVTDVTYVLDGNIPDRFQFNPVSRITPGSHGFMMNPCFADKIHVTAFVLNAFNINKIHEKIYDKLTAIKTQLNERGIPLVILLTHIDLLLGNSEQLSQTFFSSSIQESVNAAAARIGVPKSHILPVKNYESEIELDVNVDILTLVALRQILRSANDFFDDQLDCQGATGHPKTNTSKGSKPEKLEQPN